MKQKIKLFILPFSALLLLSGCSNQKSPSFATLYRDYKAGHEVKNEKYEEALSDYYSLLVDDPDRAATHSNIGVLLNMIQKPEEALKSLKHALELSEKAKDPEMIFASRYNLGVYYGKLKKVPEALENYQAALDIVPDSKEVKTNIELLIQQQKQDQQGKGEQKDQQDQNNNNQNKDQNKNQSKNDQNKDKDQKGDDNKKDQDKDQQRKSSPKYKPRPFKGDDLSEGDVKKILGELRNQEQKIRANFDKKEKKGNSKNNEKDW